MSPEDTARFIATGLELVQRVDEVIGAYEDLKNGVPDPVVRGQKTARPYAACNLNLKQARER